MGKEKMGTEELEIEETEESESLEKTIGTEQPTEAKNKERVPFAYDGTIYVSPYMNEWFKKNYDKL
jgi:hypothetical protein